MILRWSISKEAKAADSQGRQKELAPYVLVMFQELMERLTPEALEEAINSAPAFARLGASAGSELWRQTAARSLSLSIFEHLVSTSMEDGRQLTLPLSSIQMTADEA